jgi:TIR domain/SIR2-like domain
MVEVGSFDVHDLLGWIEAGSVVPVVGRQLVQVGTKDAPLTLEEHLARRLAERLEIEVGPDADLNTVCMAWLEDRRASRSRIYALLDEIIDRERPRFPRPVALARLAAVTGFDLYLTTCFDPLLLDTINDVRYGGEARARNHASAIRSNGDDLPSREPDRDSVHVFHMLGRVCSVPDYAVTDADVLEFLHHMAYGQGARHLFDRLRRSSLLMLGCSLPNWLSRFFLRILRNQPLWQPRDPEEDYVVDDCARDDPSLVLFLTHYNVRIFEGGTATDFVDRLYDAWIARHPPADGSASAGKPGTVEPGPIFISYASEDRDEATRLAKELSARKLPVWFDRRDLEFGREWEQMIEAGMNRASLCIPLISRHTDVAEPRYFNYEWYLARKRQKMMSTKWRFLAPAILDDTPQNEGHIPSDFRTHHIPELRDPEERDRFIDQIEDELHRRGRALA